MSSPAPTNPSPADLPRSAPAAPPPGPVPGLFGAIASWAYAREITRRNRLYDAGKKVNTLDRPVISVGNLSVGGTGKSPTVAWIIEQLQADRRRPCIAMRGYRAKRGTSARISDEAEEYRERFGRKVPIVARPDRYNGLRELFASPEGKDVDSVILDDGFQHRKIARDRDIVLIDATRSPFADNLLPAGWLREPVDSLKRASAVVISHAESASPGQVESLADSVARVTGHRPLAVTRHVWSGYRVIEGGRERTVPLAWFANRKVFATCAIGNPEPFLKEAQRRAGQFMGSERRRDHDAYSPESVSRLTVRAQDLGADTLVCTAKDWTKLSRSIGGQWAGAVAVPLLILVFDAGEAELRRHVLSVFGS